MGIAFHILFKKPSSTLRLWKSLQFSSIIFIVLFFTFSSLNILETIFTYNVNKGALAFLSTNTQLSCYNLLKNDACPSSLQGHLSYIKSIYACVCFWVLQFYFSIPGYLAEFFLLHYLSSSRVFFSFFLCISMHI